MKRPITLFHCAQGRLVAARRRLPRGFTLIELVVTVAIVAILAAAAMPMAEVAAQRSKEQELRASLRQIRGAIDAYRQAVEEGRIVKAVTETVYPKSLDELVEGIPDAKSPTEAKIYFLRRIPRDPLARDPNVPAGGTWGKRSYASPPDDPQEGDDVFDVYSTSAAVGLNGVPYREW